MAGTDELISKGRNYLKTTPKNKLYTYLFILVAIVGGSIVGLSFIQKETYQTLFAGLSTEDASAVVSKLKELKVPYKLGLGGTAIYVPKEKVYDVRLMLAGQNALPGGAGMGYELFDKTNYGMTEFMQNVNYKRAIQGELSRTINQMPEIKGSRVHLAIPEKTLYSEKEKETTASVFLKVKPGKALSRDQVAGIVQLVAGSIEGLRAENVTVVDETGRILYKNGGGGASMMTLSGQQYELQQSVEKTVEESVQSMLDRFMPSNKSIVRANVELNLRKVEKVEEEVAPDKRAATSEKRSKERSVNKTGAGPGGVPGVASNVPNVKGKNKVEIRTDSNSGRTSESEREETQNTYEVSKTVRKIVEPFGDIKRISVAIVLDGKYEKVKGQKGEELKYSPRSQKELNDIKGIVARAVGFDEERGDKIEILNVPFEVEPMGDEKSAMEKAERQEMFVNVGKYVFYIAIVLAIFFFLIRPLMGFLKTKSSRSPLGQIRDVYSKSAAVAGAEAPQPIENKAQSAIADAMRDKALVGSIIKEWVKEGT